MTRHASRAVRAVVDDLRAERDRLRAALESVADVLADATARADAQDGWNRTHDARALVQHALAGHPLPESLLRPEPAAGVVDGWTPAGRATWPTWPTVRAWLESVGGVDRVRCSDDSLLAAGPCAPRLRSTAGTGDLQTTCGGDVLLELYRAPASRLRVYLVYCDLDGRTWDARRARGDVAGIAPPPRPHAALRLVASI